VAGRHRKPRGAGLPPILSALLCVAALCTTVLVAQADPVPDDVPILPEPAPVARTPAPTTTSPAPTTTSATTTVAAPTIMVIPAPTTTTPPPPSTTTAAPKPKPPPTTTEAPAPKPPPVAKARPADDAPASGKCSGLGVAANVRRACNVIVAAVPGIPAIGGRAARPGNPTSCHPKGLALDLMTDSRALGDRIAAFVRANKDLLGATTILWEVPDHYDHVHVSFKNCYH
jgi:hypothetical protein